MPEFMLCIKKIFKSLIKSNKIVLVFEKENILKIMNSGIQTFYKPKIKLNY